MATASAERILGGVEMTPVGITQPGPHAQGGFYYELAGLFPRIPAPVRLPGDDPKLIYLKPDGSKYTKEEKTRVLLSGGKNIDVRSEEPEKDLECERVLRLAGGLMITLQEAELREAEAMQFKLNSVIPEDEFREIYGAAYELSRALPPPARHEEASSADLARTQLIFGEARDGASLIETIFPIPDRGDGAGWLGDVFRSYSKLGIRQRIRFFEGNRAYVEERRNGKNIRRPLTNEEREHLPDYFRRQINGLRVTLRPVI